MADNSLGFGKVKSIIDKLLRLFDNFIEGYSVKENKVTERSGGVTNSTVITTDINGNKVDVRIDLTATNVGSVFKQYTNVINNLDYNSLHSGINKDEQSYPEDAYDDDTTASIDIEARSRNQRKKNQQAKKDQQAGKVNIKGKDVVNKVKFLVGESALDRDNSGQYVGDISLANAIKRGANGGIEGGFLGVNLQQVAENGFQGAGYTTTGWWKSIADDKLKYTLVCEADNADAGKVANQGLLDCAKWVSKYIAFVEAQYNKSEEVAESTQVDKEAVLADQLSAEEKKSKEENTQLIANVLVMPILVEIQAQLRELYQDKLNEDTSLDAIIDHDATDEEASSNTQDQGDQNASDEQVEGEQSQGDLNNSDNGGDATVDNNASKHINVTLKKIQASDELAIISLDSNYLPGDTLSDVDEIINQEEFLNTLTEEPQSFAIEVDDDGFDIEPCECCQCDACASLCEVFKSGIRAYRNFYILHWMSSGNDMMKLHLMAEEMYGELQSEIDTIGELLVEKQGTVPQLDFPCDYIPVQQYEFQTGLDQIKSLIQMYIDCIDYAYCNQDSDVQSTLDEWLRYWNKQLNYFVKNQEA